MILREAYDWTVAFSPFLIGYISIIDPVFREPFYLSKRGGGKTSNIFFKR